MLSYLILKNKEKKNEKCLLHSDSHSLEHCVMIAQCINLARK